MSIIFVVLGLGFLAGGAYAIVEGWPYLLIERGFTLVISGTVLATAGVVMLALSRVMAELRGVRGQLSNAVMAVSVASLGQVRDEREPMPSPAPQAAGDGGMAVAPAALGGAAAAGGVLAAGIAAALRDEPAPAAEKTDAETPDETRRDDEPDLFAAPTEAASEVAPLSEGDAGQTPEPDPWREPELWHEPEPAVAPESPADAATERLPVATTNEFDDALRAATGDALSREPVDIEMPASAGLVDAPQTASLVDEAPDAAPFDPIDEDFDRLRDRLGFGGDRAAAEPGAAPPLAGERREPSERDIAAAADWMTAIRPGQERWIAEPVASEPAPPVWPPQTREPAPFEGLEAEPMPAPEPDGSFAANAERPSDLDEVEPEPLPTFALLPEPEPASQPEGEDVGITAEDLPPEVAAPQPEAEERSVPEPAVEPALEDETLEPSAPAASEEGVIGAYQVGEAHFTIYADGSIQARTPDGDYSFASMDELKVYLASEKSRLGM